MTDQNETPRAPSDEAMREAKGDIAFLIDSIRWLEECFADRVHAIERKWATLPAALSQQAGEERPHYKLSDLLEGVTPQEEIDWGPARPSQPSGDGLREAAKALALSEAELRHAVDCSGLYSGEGKAAWVKLVDAGDAVRAALASPAPEAEPVADVFTSLRDANLERQRLWCPDQVPDLSFRGNELGGECGEAQNVIKKLERERHGWRGSRATLADLAEELADVVICADLCAITAGIDLQAAIVAKFNATSEKVGLPVRLASPVSARQIAAETRERCAKVAEDYSRAPDDDLISAHDEPSRWELIVVRRGAKLIAEMIRSLPDTDTEGE